MVAEQKQTKILKFQNEEMEEEMAYASKHNKVCQKSSPKKI
jgi:hypothetical protein